VALEAEKLVILTDVEGIYADWPDRGSLLSDLTLSSARELLAKVDEGMVPKLEACIRAVEGGVPQSHVVDGRAPHSILLEIFTDEGIGTMVLPDVPEGSGADTGEHTREVPDDSGDADGLADDLAALDDDEWDGR
jgi:acetylglutamate kinase